MQKSDKKKGVQATAPPPPLVAGHRAEKLFRRDRKKGRRKE